MPGMSPPAKLAKVKRPTQANLCKSKTGGKGVGKGGEESVDVVKVLAAPENKRSSESHLLLTA